MLWGSPAEASGEAVRAGAAPAPSRNTGRAEPVSGARAGTTACRSLASAVALGRHRSQRSAQPLRNRRDAELPRGSPTAPCGLCAAAPEHSALPAADGDAPPPPPARSRGGAEPSAAQRPPPALLSPARRCPARRGARCPPRCPAPGPRGVGLRAHVSPPPPALTRRPVRAAPVTGGGGDRAGRSRTSASRQR